MNAVLKLTIASFVPVIASAVLYLLENKSRFGKMDYYVRQVIIGIVFGAIAILGTEWGIPAEGAVVNCRDAAPLCAGLFFGGPAGIIAGIIGGVERWVAVAWGVGSFTRVACSVSTVIAGVYAAALRKFLFDGNRPGWAISFAAGVVMESFHLLMVFVTNLRDSVRAADVVKACTKYMIPANSLAVLLAGAVIALLAGETLRFRRNDVSIEKTIQRGLLVCVFLAFVLSSVFVFFHQQGRAREAIEQELEYCVQDVAADIQYASDTKMIAKTREIAEKASEDSLDELKSLFGVDEINMVGRDGIIFASTNLDYIDFDFSSGEQSAAFLVLLHGEEEYAQPLTSITYDSRSFRKYAGVATDYGFIQVGYYSSRFHRILNEDVADITRHRHIGETGVVFILNEMDKIFSGPAEYVNYDMKRSTLLKDIEANPEHTMFTSTVWDQDSLVTYCTVEGFRIVAYENKSEAYSDRNTSLYVNTFLEVIIYAVLFAFIDILIKKLVIRRIRDINASLARIAGGDLDEVIDVRGNEEFSQLSDDINATVSTLKDYITKAEKRIEEELLFAKNIQASALPNVFPAFPKRNDFDIYSFMGPAREVGGDFYDFYLTNFDGVECLNFLVADVSGKGIPAAMFMMKAKTLLKNLTESGFPMEEVFVRANNSLCEGNDDVGMFVTAVQGRMDLKNGSMTLVNAGHNPPLVKHAGGKFEYVKLKPCLVLAGMEGVAYHTVTIDFAKGDTIFLYTDGVTEATDSDNRLYGEERLLNTLNSIPYTNMKQLCAMVKKDIDNFVGDAPQFDDITMTAFNYRGSMERRELHYDNATLDDIPEVTDFVEAALDEMGCPDAAKLKIDVIVDEIFSNICNYAYDGARGVAAVIVEETQDPHGVKLIFADRGKAYNPLEKEDPDTSLALEDRAIGGLGIFMVKNSADEVNYEYTNGRNILTVKSYF